MKGFFPSILLTLLVSLFGCSSEEGGYTTSPNGLQYRIIRDEPTKNAVPGEFIYYHVSWRTMQDSILFDSRKSSDPFVSLVARPLYEGDPWELFTLLSPGDSAVCKLPAKVIYKSYLPKNLKPDDPMKMDLRIMNVLSATQYDSVRHAAALALKGREDQMLQTYMRENGLTGTKTPSGLYVVMEMEGKGPQAVNGNTLRVDYTGRLLNGKEFDSSQKPGREPFQLVLGAGSVIRGWDEGLTYFKEGGKGKLLIPSSLAYGERGSPPNIGPNEPLVFDIALVEIL